MKSSRALNNITLTISACFFSHSILTALNDREGPNAPVVLGLALVIYGVTYGLLTLTPLQTSSLIKENFSLVSFAVQAVVSIVVYLTLL